MQTHHWQVDITCIKLHVDLLVDKGLTVFMIILPNSWHLDAFVAMYFKQRPGRVVICRCFVYRFLVVTAKYESYAAAADQLSQKRPGIWMALLSFQSYATTRICKKHNWPYCDKETFPKLNFNYVQCCSWWTIFDLPFYEIFICVPICSYPASIWRNFHLMSSDDRTDDTIVDF